MQKKPFSKVFRWSDSTPTTTHRLNIKIVILGFFLGPNLETRQELYYLQKNGIDLIGWSMVPEVLTAAHCGFCIVGITVVSDISNPKLAKNVTINNIEQGAQLNQNLFTKVLSKVITKYL